MKKRRKLILFLLLLLLLLALVTIIVVMPRVNSEAKSHGILSDINDNSDYSAEDNTKSNKKKEVELENSNGAKEDTKYENINNKKNEKTSSTSNEKKDDNKIIKEFIPSVGELSPAFDNDILDYELKVDKDTDIIDFEIDLESELSSVIGNKNILVDELEKEIKIIVTAEDGTEKIITVTIIKESSVTDILLEKDQIMIGEGEEYQINARIVPETAVSKDLIYQSSDDTIIAVDETGKVIGNKIGTASITITSKDNENIEKTLIVNVVAKQIESEVYYVIEKEEGKIIIGAEPGETISEFIEKLRNEESTIEIYDKEGNKIEDYEEIVKTGQTLKLVIDNNHNGIVIIKGDINEDGIVDLSDKAIIQDHILSKNEINGYKKYAADLNNDDIIDALDNAKITNYILGKITSLN